MAHRRTMWRKIRKCVRRARPDETPRDEAIRISFSYHDVTSEYPLCEIAVFMSDDLCACTRSPSDCRLNCLITKTCSRCSELSEALWRDLIESVSNKTSLLVFPFLNTPKGTSVMQFPSTLRPLAAAAGALPSSVGCCFIATSALWWGGGGGPAFSMSEPGHRSPWTSTPALHYLHSASIPAGGHVSE